MIAWWANLFGRRRIQVDPDGAWAALRAGRLQEATDLLGQCRANGQDSPALNRLATHIGWQQHDLGAAAGLLETALRLLPDAPLRHELEATRLAIRSPDALAQAFEGALLRDPMHPMAGTGICARLLLTQADASQVFACVEAAWGTQRENPHLCFLYGRVLVSAGRLSEATGALRDAARLAPTSGPILHQLGKLLEQTGLQSEAIDYLELSVHHAPSFEAAWIDLMRVLDLADDLDAAIDAARRFALALPSSAEGAFWIGKFSERRGDLAAASTAYESALALKPQSAPIMTNYGLLLLELGRIPQANQLLAGVATRTPADAAAQMNLGLALRFAGDLEGALDSFRTALTLAPEDAMTRYHLATTHLLRQEFAEGWDHYDARWQQDIADPRRPSGSPWTGEALEDQHLLVWGEQGLGDHIMFASCIVDAARTAKTCTVECHPRLQALFERSFPRCTVVGGSTQNDLDMLAKEHPYDVHVPFGDLPGIVRRSGSDFPGHAGYLVADEGKRRTWRTRLAGLPGQFKVGISWIGGVRQTGKTRRSMPLLTWAPLLTLPDIDFVSLQYTRCEPELEQVKSTLGVTIQHWQDAIDDLDETAALISELDAVISVCNTTVHLTGALGKPVWVLTPFVAEWRYLAQGVSMPWYPSAKLVRQQAPDDWGSVIDSVAQELVTPLGSRS